VYRASYDQRCDIWSIGVVLYIMLSGHRPFEALDINGPLKEAGKAAMITNILACRYHFHHHQFKYVSKESIRFIETLLHPDYTTRIHAKEALDHPWVKGGKAQQQLASNALLSQVASTEESHRALTNLKQVTSQSTLRHTGSVAVAFGMQPRAAAEMRALFQTFDADASGTLSLAEFILAMNHLAPELSKQDIEYLFDIIDIDKDAGISYTEFLAATLNPRDIDVGDLNKAFKLMDTDGNGYITFDELINMLNVRPDTDDGALQPDFEDRVREMIRQCDRDNDGVISYEGKLCGSIIILGLPCLTFLPIF
jgi:calcium-dependent protein kinase